jgi:hypothetical protein
MVSEIDLSEIHESHRPEGPDVYLSSGLVWCMVCCKLVATKLLGVRSRGRQPCAGPLKIRPFEEVG